MTLAWTESTIANEFEVQLGKRVDAAVARGVPKVCINNRGVRWGRIDTSEAAVELLTKADLHELRLIEGDVLVCEGGEIGRASVWRGELPEAYFLNTLHRLRSRGRFEPDLIVALLERWVMTGELQALVGKSSLAHLTKENLLRIRLPMPTRGEQKRMAGALRASDELITSLGRLIAKKRDIKHGLVQELLTGRFRIGSVAGAWPTARLLDLVTIVSGQVDPRRPEFRDLPLIAPDHIESGTGRLLAVETASEQGAISGKYLAEPGDVIYSKIRPYLRKAHVARFRTLCSADMYPLRPKSGVDPEFILNTLLGARFTDFAASASMRSGIPKINRVELAAFELAAPPSGEQQEIAEVLVDADAEIAALERRLESARAIKVGMMQELLSGRTRLHMETVS